MSIVVSPLKALMRDQAAEWEGRGVRCAILSEEKMSEEARNGTILFTVPSAKLYFKTIQDSKRNIFSHIAMLISRFTETC